MKTSSKVALGIGIPISLLAAYLLTRKPVAAQPFSCAEGTVECWGPDKYQCVDNKMVLVEENSFDCGYALPLGCTDDRPENTQYMVAYFDDANSAWISIWYDKTVGSRRRVMENTHGDLVAYLWDRLIDQTISRKQFDCANDQLDQFTCTFNTVECRGLDKYQCVDGKMVLVDSNSPDCGYVPLATCEGEFTSDGDTNINYTEVWLADNLGYVYIKWYDPHKYELSQTYILLTESVTFITSLFNKGYWMNRMQYDCIIEKLNALL